MAVTLLTLLLKVVLYDKASFARASGYFDAFGFVNILQRFTCLSIEAALARLKKSIIKNVCL